MTYQVLARKWRPRKFSEVVGQDHVVRALSNALARGQLHHAWLLTGTRGVGKTTLARILAKALNCAQGVVAEPCGECGPCREIDAGRFEDLLELDAASHTGVDNMREILENARYAPASGRYKVYIIDEVHMLSKAAFNSMLKTLEEPPEHVKFVLATTDPQKIPVTVLSRCLQFNLKHLPPPTISQQLGRILGTEGIDADRAALAMIAGAAEGSMRDALSLLDQAIAYGSGKVDAELVRQMLGTVDRGQVLELCEALADGDGPRLMAVADGLWAMNAPLEATLADLCRVWADIALAQLVPGSLEAEAPGAERLATLAERLGAEEVQLYYQIAANGYRDIADAPDLHAGFTMTLLRMLAFRPGVVDEPAARAPVARPVSPAPRSAPPPSRRDVAPPVGERMPAATAVQPPAVVVPPIPSVDAKPLVGQVPGRGELLSRQEPLAEEPASVPTPRALDMDRLNWRQLVGELGGPAAMLARHSEPKSLKDGVLELLVGREGQPLAKRGELLKVLEKALAKRLGTEIRVRLSTGAAELTPAELDRREKDERQAKAKAAIETDPFVNRLVEHYGATVVESSITARNYGKEGVEE